MSTVTRTRRSRAPRAARRHATSSAIAAAAPGPGVENAEIARILREVGDLLEVEGANPFRIRAYRNAARTVEAHPERVDALARTAPERLTELPGIGEDLAGKIVEIVGTGRLAALAELERAAPAGIVELMRVPTLGPRRARALAEQLGVRSLAGLRRAAESGKVRDLPGFGTRTEERILHELETRGAEAPRVLRARAAQYGEALLAHVRAIDGVERADLAGSFRRCRETVGDLDILAAAKRGADVGAGFVTYPAVRDVLAQGPTRASVRLRSGIQVDLRVLPPESYGSGLHYLTGSKAHNIAIRRLGQERGLKINEYGVWRGTRRIGGREEREVFEAVGLPWIPPELREDAGEIDAARDGKLPKLVELADIRGDLQMHTTDSDGRDTLEAMVEGAQALGYEYVAITDHTPNVRVAGGLDRAGFRRQMKRIAKLNGALHGIRVLAGAEVDILPDGTLDLDDDTLAALDVVVVSLHARLTLPAPEQTRRVLRALAHPSVDILAHPTGRLIDRRHGADFALDEVLRAAGDQGLLLEVNGQPERLDLNEVMARAAIDHGVKLVVDTDAHAVQELRFMRWGVDQARRGWAERADVANTLPLARFLALLHGKR